MKSNTLFDQYSTIPLVDIGNSYMKFSPTASNMMGLVKGSKILFNEDYIANLTGINQDIKATAFKVQCDKKYQHLFIFCESLTKRIGINEGLYRLGDVDHHKGIDYYQIKKLEIL